MTTEDMKMSTAADDLIASLTHCVAEEARARKVVSDLQNQLQRAQTLHLGARTATHAAEDEIKKRAIQNALLTDSTLKAELTAQPN